jgi:hypothetical protein
MQIINTHYIKQNSLLFPVEFQFLDGNGKPIPLTGATVTFVMAKDGHVKVNRAAVLTDAALGKGRFNWAAGDTDIPGVWEAELNALMPGNIPLGAPNKMNLKVVIIPALAGN